MVDKIDDSYRDDEGRIQETQTGNIEAIYVPELPEANLAVEPTDYTKLPPPQSTGLGVYNIAFSSELRDMGITLPVIAARPTIDADFAIPAHKLASERGETALTEIAARVGDRYSEVETSVDGSFINFKINREILGGIVLDEIESLGPLYGSNSGGQGEVIVIDTSSPNIAKQMHLGHLRSTVIGESLSRILQFNGYTTIRDNHVGDWGTQFGLLGRAVELWGDEVPQLTSDNPAEQVSGLLELYVRINQEIAIQKTQSETDTSELEDAGREWFLKLEQDDPEAIEFWRWASNVSMLEFEQIYQALGVNFEYVLGESVYQTSLESTIRAYKEAGLTFVDQKGVVKVTPSKSKADALGIQKPDGASLYGTRDLAALEARLRWFNPEKILYVVGAEQEAYFSNLFDAFKQYSNLNGQNIDAQHIKFGKVTLPEGVMSTRKGNVVFLIDVLNTYREAALEKVQANMERRGISITDEEIIEIAEQVAIGALVYFDLHGSAARDIIYDPADAVSFEGNTGPSLQYTVARINALLGKVDDAELEYVDSATVQIDESEAGETTSELIVELSKFPDIVQKAAEKYEPSIVSEYLHQLSTKFNRFYKVNPVLQDHNANTRHTKIQLCKATRQVMTNGLHLLNIPSPEKM